MFERLPTLGLAIALGAACATPSPGPVEKVHAADSPTLEVVKPKMDPDVVALVPSLKSPTEVETTIPVDFDGDGILDLAVVTVSSDIDPLRPDDVPRTLTMGIRDGTSFRAVQSTTCVAMCPQCGGIMGDPYQGIDAGQDGTIIVKNYGGSRERWSVHYTVAFHDGAFQIVAVKRSTFDSLKPKSIKENTLELRPGVGTNAANGSASHNLTPVRIDACQDVEKL